jgi:hypothetical protein
MSSALCTCEGIFPACINNFSFLNAPRKEAATPDTRATRTSAMPLSSGQLVPPPPPFATPLRAAVPSPGPQAAPQTETTQSLVSERAKCGNAHCGRENPHDSNFCNACGKRLNSMLPPARNIDSPHDDTSCPPTHTAAEIQLDAAMDSWDAVSIMGFKLGEGLQFTQFGC